MQGIALFIAGVAVGLFIYRMIVQLSCGTTNLTLCDHCRYRHEKTAGGRRSE